MLEFFGLQVIKWYVDVDFAIYHDMHRPNRIMMTPGKGYVYGYYGNQNLNTNS